MKLKELPAYLLGTVSGIVTGYSVIWAGLPEALGFITAFVVSFTVGLIGLILIDTHEKP